MAVITIGESHLFGVSEPLPPKGFPEGRIRWRIRNNEFTRAYVKTPDGIRLFIVKQKGGYWVPGCEQGRNDTSIGCKSSRPWRALMIWWQRVTHRAAPTKDS